MAAIYAMVAVNGMVVVYSCHGNCMYCMIRIGSIGEFGRWLQFCIHRLNLLVQIAEITSFSWSSSVD